MKIKKIASETNATFKLLLKLKTTHGIRKNGLSLLSGPKQVREVLKEFPDQCRGIIFSDDHEPPDDLTVSCMPSYCLKAGLFRQIDFYDTGQPILLVNVGTFPKWDEKSSVSGCTLCIPFQDPTNVGAVIRSASAFGISRVVVFKEAAHPFHHKSLRVAGSSIFRVPILEGPSIYDLKSFHAPVITLSPNGKNVKDFRFPPSFCLIPGLEGPGLPEHLVVATCLSIPMAPGVESLNAAMATGIVLYLWKEGMKTV